MPIAPAVAAAGIGAAASIYGAHKNSQAQNKATEAQNNQQTHLYDPTNPLLKGLGQQQIGQLGQVAQGQDIYAGMRSNEFSQAASAGLQGFNNNASQGAFGQTNQALSGIMNGAGPQMPQGGFNALQFGGVPQTQMQLSPMQLQQAPVQAPNLGVNAGNVGTVGNPFQELQTQQMQFGANPFASQMSNPFAEQGAVNPGMGVVQAAQPIFERNLRTANAGLAGSAPGRFSTAFAQQGNDLNATALQDFNMFAGQQLQQGAQLQAQQQAAAQQFMLGSRGLAQDAFGQQQQMQLGAQDLFQQGQQGARSLQQQSEIDYARRQLEAQMANQGTRLGEANLNLQGVNALNQANLGATGLMQEGQLGLRGLEQQLGLGMQQNQIGAYNAQTGAQLGAMGQQLQADGQNQQFALGAYGAQTGAQLGAAQQMMANALGLDANSFAQLMSLFGAGQQQSQNMINPLLAMQQTGLQYGMPSDLNAIVGGGGVNPQVQQPYNPLANVTRPTIMRG